MNKMKKTLIAAGLLALFSASVAANETLTVGATPVPHAEILEFVKPELAKQGVDLKIKVFNDFIQPNQQLAEKNLDANYYQYRPFLDNYNQTRHTHLVPVVGVHIEPFGAYSSKYTTSKRCRMAPPSPSERSGEHRARAGDVKQCRADYPEKSAGSAIGDQGYHRQPAPF
jgi:ABC-type metal ion transport system substrate-binding protein